jgi:hypothetical protein
VHVIVELRRVAIDQIAPDLDAAGQLRVRAVEAGVDTATCAPWPVAQRCGPATFIDDSRDAPSDCADACEALGCAGDAAIAAMGTGAIGMLLSDRARSAPRVTPAPSAGPRAARPVARAAARQAPPQDDTVQESSTTIEWLSALLPSGRLTLSRTEGGARTLHCQAADLEALRGAVARLGDRLLQRALGALQICVD